MLGIPQKRKIARPVALSAFRVGDMCDRMAVAINAKRPQGNASEPVASNRKVLGRRVTSSPTSVHTLDSQPKGQNARL
jgi:hypothetical protein